MASNAIKPLRCAVYTRKSTEHGLDLEFNSLHAQREACEAYIKSQASQGWQCIPEPYDDPAFSGGNLDRPALKRLLADIDAGEVDVIVVYKIDRLTRSLADFAKLVEAFDAKSISFVAVTQQFNTTTSMGRLTLNVLLSFAQFERELSSERVRDKVAASRQKGKWTGGTIPLGYDIKDKKLVPHATERKTVEYIFTKYLELQGFQKLIADLDAKGIVTKRRTTKLKKYQGGIPFTYGPLAYLLKNRLYIGEMAHKDKWYRGEHKPILDRKLFESVQALLKSHKVERRVKRTQSGALLMGKLYDDRGNLMSPSYSTKKGVRYRFYVSSALLRGRKADAGSVSRIAAIPVETAITEFISREFAKHLGTDGSFRELLHLTLARIDLRKSSLRLSLLDPDQDCTDGMGPGRARIVDLPWSYEAAKSPFPHPDETTGPDPQLVNAIVRAHAWVKLLNDGKFDTIETLAEAVKLNPNVLRQNIRFAFLDPHITDAIIQGRMADISITDLAQCNAISWKGQTRDLLGAE
ncbi:recombinase family protein [Afipia broomeae]|uniref:Resolvase/invertase-type recombinase catalytic domain-containing protein n=1 Tax=Afipia broomeae ATCC 49717 TaxID=883078 RepID=K8PFP8_9BRAD|nr:recombinase family protein [Afipia broomeae]EKS41462.1 hypothetical protein HMPREF9695_00554 [Afipia broomeae ATCC 49717]